MAIFGLLWLPEGGLIFLEVGLIRKFCWSDFARKRWVVLQEMFVGGGLDSRSLGEGCCRSLLAFVLKGPDSGFLHYKWGAISSV